MKYTIPVSPEFLQDLATGDCARLMMAPGGDKYKCTVSVDREDGTTFDVPVRLRVDNVGCIYVTFEA
jgi:hypothetical protein